MNFYDLIVPEALDGRDIHAVLRGPLQMAEGFISSLKFRDLGIQLNGQPARVTQPVHTGDCITVRLDDDGINPAAPLPDRADIRYEDDYMAIVSKPAGTAVYGENGPNLSGMFATRWGNTTPFHPVNRLDVGTSGLLVIARCRYMHDRLRRLLHTEDFRREYLAVCLGRPDDMAGSITLPIGRTPDSIGNHHIDPDGLPCRTDYTVLASYEDRALLRLRLYTGRTHQIRVHLAAIGHPLLGDARYGTPSPLIARPPLHSYRLVLRHPLRGEILDLRDPLPPDIAALLPDSVDSLY